MEGEQAPDRTLWSLSGVGAVSQVLTGSPFEIGIVSGVADPSRCLASMIGTDSSERSTEAGTEFAVAQELRDRFDNVTLLAGEGSSRCAGPKTLSADVFTQLSPACANAGVAKQAV